MQHKLLLHIVTRFSCTRTVIVSTIYRIMAEVEKMVMYNQAYMCCEHTPVIDVQSGFCMVY